MIKAVRSFIALPSTTIITTAIPAEKGRIFRGKPDGVHTWTLAEMAKYEATPSGRYDGHALRAGLALYTGQRRLRFSSIFGPNHDKTAGLVFRQTRTQKSQSPRNTIVQGNYKD